MNWDWCTSSHKPWEFVATSGYKYPALPVLILLVLQPESFPYHMIMYDSQMRNSFHLISYNKASRPGLSEMHTTDDGNGRHRDLDARSSEKAAAVADSEFGCITLQSVKLLLSAQVPREQK